jgi:hypothetical protein
MQQVVATAEQDAPQQEQAADDARARAEEEEERDLAEQAAAEDAEAEAQAKEATATAQQPKQDDTIRYMPPSGVTMRVFTRAQVSKYGLILLTGDKEASAAEIEAQAERGHQEPRMDAAKCRSATYQLEYLRSFITLAKKLGAEQVKLTLNTDEPLLAEVQLSDRSVVKEYIAPYVEG